MIRHKYCINLLDQICYRLLWRVNVKNKGKRRMVFKSILGATCACLAVVSFNVSAALVSVDWKASGDELIARDIVSGLDWLSLTETHGLTYNYVISQLSPSGSFEGFRIASSAEVVSMFNNFGIDLSPEGIIGSNTYDSNIYDAGKSIGGYTTTTLFEDPDIVYSAYERYTVMGVTNDDSWEADNSKEMVGVLNRTEIYRDPTLESNIFNFYEKPGGPGAFVPVDSAYYDIGVYLVRESVVPLPSAVWLFGSGLIGLLAVSRRKA